MCGVGRSLGGALGQDELGSARDHGEEGEASMCKGTEA